MEALLVILFDDMKAALKEFPGESLVESMERVTTSQGILTKFSKKFKSREMESYRNLNEDSSSREQEAGGWAVAHSAEPATRPWDVRQAIEASEGRIAAAAPSSSASSTVHYTPSSVSSTSYEKQLAAPQSTMDQFSFKMSNSTQKKHKCKICDKRFTRLNSPQTHMYGLIGEKPFVREVESCGWHFSVVSNLRRHRKAHKDQVSASSFGDEHSD